MSAQAVLSHDQLFAGVRPDIGESQTAVAYGDVDGNGSLDIVVADENRLSIAFNNGDGSFSRPITTELNRTVRALAVGDVNGDGNLDIAVGLDFPNQVSILLGTGDGEFGQPVAYAAGHRVTSIAIADINGNGAPDIVTASETGNSVSVLLGGGDGSYGSPAVTTVGTRPIALAVGDFSGDGLADIVTANFQSMDLSFLLGAGDGTFTAAPTIPIDDGRPTDLALGDLNGSDTLDLAVSVEAGIGSDLGRVAIFVNSGEGTFSHGAEYPVGYAPKSLALADFDDDGTLDVAVGNSLSHDLAIFLGNGDATFTDHAKISPSVTPNFLAAADFNGNGSIDLLSSSIDGLASYHSISLLFGAGDGNFKLPGAYATGNFTQDVAVGDLNRNGRPDIVGANWSDRSISVLLGIGDGSFASQVAYSTGIRPERVLIADLDGNGAQDAVTANLSTGEIAILSGNGNGEFASPILLETGLKMKAIRLADLNRDGKPDLVVLHRGETEGEADEISILLGNGVGTFDIVATYPVGWDSRDFAIGDVDGNGHLDIVAIASNHGDNFSHGIAILLGQGNGTFGPRSTLEGHGLASLALGDVSRNGHLDIITDGQAIQVGRGDGTFLPPKVFVNEFVDLVGIVAIADTTGDGNLDIVTASGNLIAVYTSQQIASLLQSDRDFLDVPAGQRPTRYSVGATTSSLAVSDFNSDGIPDVVTANGAANHVTVLLGTNEDIMLPPLLHRMDSNPGSLDFMDVNADGLIDILTTADLDFQYSASTILTVSTGTDQGTFAKLTEYISEKSVWGSVVADFNGDGRADYAFLDPITVSIDVLYGTPSGEFTYISTLKLDEGGHFPWYDSLLAFDVNSDGHSDLIAMSHKLIAMQLNDGSGSFTTGPTIHFEDGISRAVSGDLNGDGKEDLLLVNDVWSQDAQVTALLNDGNGNFQAADPFNTSSNLTSTILVDLTGNGILDMVSVNAVSDDVSVFFGNGDGTFEPEVKYLVGASPRSIASGDLNGDGILDLVTANQASGDITILLGIGNGEFRPGSSLPVSAGPTYVGVADLNGNGRLDIVTANASEDSMSLLYMRPATNRFAHEPSGSVAPGVDHLLVTFPGTVERDAFSLAENVGRFEGPGGPITPSALTWINDRNFRLDFPPQTAMGNYELLIVNTAGEGFTSQSFLATFAITGPRITSQSPIGWVSPDFGSLRFTFDRAIDTGSVDLGDGIISFSGPHGPITPSGFSWLNDRTLEIDFEGRIAGEYTMVVASGIKDMFGNALDINRNLIGGEVPGDRYVASFAIPSLRIIGFSPDQAVGGPVESARIRFNRPIDADSLLISRDIVSFTGPTGDVTVTGFDWLDETTLQLNFDARIAGDYLLVLGSGLTDKWGNTVAPPGSGGADFHNFSFTITSPRVIGRTPNLQAILPVDTVRLFFDREMDPSTFSIDEGIVSFVGPQGAIIPTGHHWSNAKTLEISFPAQNTSGEYQLVLGASVADEFGNSISPYTANWLSTFSGVLNQDTTWTPSHGAVIVSGTLVVPQGVTLTILPGTLVKFLPNARLRIDGSLIANGDINDLIVFTSIDDDSTHGDSDPVGGAPLPAAGSWQGLSAGNGAMLELSGFEIRYAITGLTFNARGAQAALFNGIVRNNRDFGIYVFSPFVEVEANNLLIADNGLSGVFVRADSRHVFRNSTIVGNGFRGNGQSGAGVHLGGANLTLENTIVAYNQTELHHQGDPPQLTVRNSLFFNPSGQTVSWGSNQTVKPDLSLNGNQVADPLFVDRGGRDYELANGSPAIDAGRGISASVVDILGRPRYDDRGMANRGHGYPSFVDIGAFERQSDTATADLAVASAILNSSSVINPGESVSLTWTVTNRGNRASSGSWADAVYLSRYPYRTSSSVLLAPPIEWTGSLAVGESYSRTLTANVLDITGPLYVVVQANHDGSFQEALLVNNSLAVSAILAVGVPVLDIGVPVPASTGTNEWHYFRYESPVNISTTINLDFDSGQWELYARRHVPPTSLDFDFASSAPGGSSRRIRLPETQGETIYIGVTRRLGETSDFVLSAVLPGLQIRHVEPREIGGSGTSTLRISGDGFTNGTEIRLVAENGTEYSLPGVVEHSGLISSSFDPSQHLIPPGMYAARIALGGDQVVLPDAVHIVEGVEWGFDARIAFPAVTRPGREVTVEVTVENRGTADLPSPVLVLAGDREGFAWRLPGQPDWIESPGVRFLAVSAEGGPPLLRPGQKETLNIRMRTPFEAGRYNVELFSIGSPLSNGEYELLDETGLYLQLLPSDLSLDDWHVGFPSVMQALGDSSRDYIVAIGKEFERWQSAGVRVYDADTLLRGIVDRALERPTGILSGRIVTSETDLPVANQAIRLQNRSTSTTFDLVSDESGGFALYGIAPGEYTVVAANHVVLGEDHLVIVDGQDLTGIRLRVAAAASIHGRIESTDSGELVRGALITLSSIDGSLVQTTRSDPLGNFRFDEVTTGTFDITVTAADHLPVTPVRLHVTSSTQDRIDFALDPGGSITGGVTDAAGHPTVDALVSILGRNTGVSQFAVTDEQGVFDFLALPDDSYTVSVSSSSLLAPIQQTLEVNDGAAISNANFVLPVGSTISGTVSSSDGAGLLRGATVQLLSTQLNIAPVFVETDEQGRYRLEGVPSGAWRLLVSHSEYLSRDFTAVLIAGETIAGRDFVLDPAAMVTGVIHGESGTPLAGVQVTLRSVGDTSLNFSSFTDTNGVYRVGVKAGRDYRVTAHLTGFAPHATNLSVTGAVGENSVLNLTMAVATPLHGRVIDSEGVPIRDAVVTLQGREGTFLTETSDAGGRWSLDAGGPSVFYLTVRAPGYVTHATLLEGYDASWQAGKDIELITAGSLSGTVGETPDGDRIENAILSITDLSGNLVATGSTNSDGAFLVSDLAPGLYRLNIAHPAFGFERVDFVIQTGQATHLDVLAVTSSLEVLVQDPSGLSDTGDVVLLLLHATERGYYQIESLSEDRRVLFHSVPTGRYHVYAIGENMLAALERDVTVQGTPATLAVTLETGKVLAGRVIDGATGLPVADAVVGVSFADPGSAGLNQIRVEEDGRFASSALPGGTYRVTITATGYAPITSEVELSDSGELTFEMSQEGLSVVVSVMDKDTGLPIHGVMVAAYFNDQLVRTNSSDAAGDVSLNNMTPGEYTLVLSYRGNVRQMTVALESDQPIPLELKLGGPSINQMLREDLTVRDYESWLQSVLGENASSPTLDASDTGLAEGGEVAGMIDRLITRHELLEATRIRIFEAWVQLSKLRDEPKDGRAEQLEHEVDSLHQDISGLSSPQAPEKPAFPHTFPELQESYNQLNKQFRVSRLLYLAAEHNLPMLSFWQSGDIAGIRAMGPELDDAIVRLGAAIDSYRLSDLNGLQQLIFKLRKFGSSLPDSSSVLTAAEISALFSFRQQSIFIEAAIKFSEVEMLVASTAQKVVQFEQLSAGTARLRRMVAAVEKYEDDLIAYTIDLTNKEALFPRARNVTQVGTEWLRFATGNVLDHARMPLASDLVDSVVDWHEPFPPGFRGNLDGSYDYIALTGAGEVAVDFQILVTGQDGKLRESNVARLTLVADPLPRKKEEEQNGNSVASMTPEDKFGPAGYDPVDVVDGNEQRFVTPGQSMAYRVEFWNDEDAEVPTQDAVIYDILDPAIFDFSTFEFTRIGFLEWDRVLAGGQSIDVRIDTRPKMNIAVDVLASFDHATGRIEWWFRAVDAITGDYPEDPFAGFLPPFDPLSQFEIGWVEYRVQAWPNLPSGTRIENQAFVQFDFLPNPKTGLEWGPAPPDGPWVNTIDADPPTSRVVELPEQVIEASFLVAWEGDDGDGSGVDRFDVYVSENDGLWMTWLVGVNNTSAWFLGEFGSSYAFNVVAVDNVGYRESKDLNSGSVQTLVVQPANPRWQNPHYRWDVNDDGEVAPLDALLVLNFLARRESDSHFPPAFEAPYFDVSGNDDITPLDALLVLNYVSRQMLQGEGEGPSELDRVPTLGVPQLALGGPFWANPSREELNRQPVIRHRPSRRPNPTETSPSQRHGDAWGIGLRDRIANLDQVFFLYDSSDDDLGAEIDTSLRGQASHAAKRASRRLRQ